VPFSQKPGKQSLRTDGQSAMAQTLIPGYRDFRRQLKLPADGIKKKK
jgi:hypothetical protein